MKKWRVLVPFTGYISTEVEADTEEEALEKGYEDACNNIEFDADFRFRVEEWDFTKHVTRGNVTYAVLNDIDAELVDDDEG